MIPRGTNLNLVISFENSTAKRPPIMGIFPRIETSCTRGKRIGSTRVSFLIRKNPTPVWQCSFAYYYAPTSIRRFTNDFGGWPNSPKMLRLLPSCLPQALPSEGSMDIRIHCSKKCVPGTRHHLQIVHVNPDNPISFDVQSHILQSPMLSQPHPIYALRFQCSNTQGLCPDAHKDVDHN
jgi:hypothetical protein